MKMDMNELLTKALEPDESAPNEVNQQILREYRKVTTMKKTKNLTRFPKTAAAICAMVLICSVSVVAAIKHFTPSEIAIELSDQTLATAFESDNAVLINESQTFEDYKVTLLGLVSGEDLTDFVMQSDSPSFELAKGQSFIVTAIEKTDGTPMPDTSDADYGEPPFFCSAYIKGQNPALVNAFTMDGGYSELVKDGIMYRILACDNLEIFADKGVYLGVTSSTFYDSEAYVWNEEDGTLTQNSDYEGINALFTLPFEKSLADPEAAEEYLNAVLNPETKGINTSSVNMELDADSGEGTSYTLYNSIEADDADNNSVNGAVEDSQLVNADGSKLSKEETKIRQMSLDDPEFDNYYTLLEDSVQTLTPDEDDMVEYQYDGFSATNPYSALFPDNTPGISESYEISEADDNLIKTFYELTKDGKIIARSYEYTPNK